jgi:alkyl hydroperoxide reductase subunit AhpC
VLPAEGDVISLRVSHNLKQALSFPEEELQALEMKVDAASGRVEWKTDSQKDVEVGPRAFTLIADRLDALSRQGKLHEDHLGLYDRFHPVEAA